MGFARKLLVGALFLSGWFFWCAPAEAFEVSPTRQVLTVDLGSQSTVGVEIKNTDTETRKYFLKVLGVKQDKNGLPEFGEYLEIAEQWVKPEAESLVLKAGQTGQARFVVRVPKNYAPGSHYLGLAVAVGAGAGEVRLNQEIISLLTLQVAGQVTEQTKIEKWQAQKNITGDRDWNFLFRIKNSGDVVLSANADLTLWNWQREIVGEKRILEQKVFFDNSTRELETKIIPTGKFLWPGPYRAQVRVVYGISNQEITANAYFWYLPNWSYAALLGLVLLVLLVGFLMLRKKRG